MLRSYFLLAWRNILRYRFYSLVNIAGLCVGILFVLLIGAYVWNETSINKSLRNAKQQYFLRSVWKDPNLGPDITTLGPLAKRLKESYPGLVANYYRWDGLTSIVSRGDKHLREGIQLGDSTLLSMYGFDLLHGDVRTALNNPFSVVITRSIAEKYFGRNDVVGETLGVQSFSGGKREFTITAVLKDPPENSVTHLNENTDNSIFIPVNSIGFFGRFDFENWGNIYLPSYIELKSGVKPEDLQQPIRKLIADNTSDLVKANLHVELIPLTEYYLTRNDALVKKMLYALSFVALFILLMAVVNFINISISSSSARTREIGIRKVLGGLRKQIVFQFLMESLILVTIATLIAVALYPSSRSVFATLVDKEIPALTVFPVYFLLFPVGIVLLVGLMAGLYPALVLSSLKSVDSLKGKLRSVKENVWLRKSLVGFQFGVAAVVMIAAYIVSQQVSYFFGKSLGYNKEYVVSSQTPRDWTPEGTRRMLAIRDEFARMPEVKSVSLSYEIPNGMNGLQPAVYKAGTDSVSAIAMMQLVTDENYLNTYEIKMKAGSFFRNNEPDTSKVVINETAARALGWSNAADALSQRVRISGNPIEFRVEGVVSDFHFTSMQQKMDALFFVQPRFANSYRYLSFKIKPGNVGPSIAAIQQKWSALMPGTAFEYAFMDQTLEKLYATEIQLQKAAYAASALALVIVLLGVLGMVSLSIQKRTREIGIRKVIGASVPEIILLFVKEFFVIIVVAGVVACPFAFIVMQNWLEGYNHRVQIGPQPFIWSVGILCLVTLLLIVARTSRAAMTNPVKSLKTE
jgi:putative ABC transport system permease protein